jgi:predicted phosphodiesterase
MQRLLLGLAVVVVLGVAVAFSRPSASRDDAGRPHDFKIETAAKNPWTHLRLNRDPDQFQFAVVSDRTGGHRAKVFSQAVHRLNLLQPEFVVSVGDLIEGYSQKPEVVAKEWDEFDGYVKQLEMPFFYVPGNHDVTNAKQADVWGGRYGRSYYHFTYKGVLFVALNSEDGKASQVTPAQAEAVRRACEENKAARWTLVFVHKPLWADKDLAANGWAAVEKALEGRKYTVFCGHVHRYQKYVRNGMNYYQLATTGGGSKLRGVGYGEFDHLTWITMKKDGPLLANVLLDGVLPEDLKVPESAEPDNPQLAAMKQVPLHPTRATVTWRGQPVAGAVVTLHGKPVPTGRERAVADGLTGADGAVTLSTLSANDGVPAGEYRVTVTKSATGGYHDAEERGAKSLLPERYADKDTSGLTAVVVAGRNEIALDLK